MRRSLRSARRLGSVALFGLLSGCLPTALGSTSVDLLTLVDLSQDQVAGKWSFDGSVLVSPTVRFGRLQIPYQPPEEYDLTLVAERVEGANSVVLGLVAGGRSIALVIDAFDHDTTSGLDQIDHRPFPETETAWKGSLLVNRKPSTIEVSVRRARLGVKVDGKSIIDWPADYKRVSLFPDWRVPLDRALFLGAWTAPYRIHSLKLTPLGVPGIVLRPR